MRRLPLRPPSPLKAAVAQLKLTLPRDLNDSVTATDVRADDMTIVYVLDIRPGHECRKHEGLPRRR